MTKNIKDYVHLYFGAEARISFSDEPEYYTTTVTGAMLKRLEDEPHDTSVALVLRPLSSMTQEEAIECLHLVMDGCYVIIDPVESILKTGFYPQNNILQNAKGIQWLLSKGFDLFGLIEDKLAVQKKQ